MITATSSLIALVVLAGNDPAGLNILQQILAPHMHTLVALWAAVWCTTAVWVLIILFRDGERSA